MSKSKVKPPKELPDEVLMKKFIQNRDRDAFTQIYERYFVNLSKYISWLMGDPEQAKDIAQNIFIKIYNRPEIFDPSKNLKVWLFTVAKNRWKNEVRNKGTRIKHHSLFAEYQYEETPDSEQEIVQHRLKRLNSSLGDLSELHKEVVVLKYSNNLSIKEISQVLNCSEGTVKSRLFYALKHLRKELGIAKTRKL